MGWARIELMQWFILWELLNFHWKGCVEKTEKWKWSVQAQQLHVESNSQLYTVDGDPHSNGESSEVGGVYVGFMSIEVDKLKLWG